MTTLSALAWFESAARVPRESARVWAALALAAVVQCVVAAEPARVESFSPQGEVKSVRQVVARFSQPMVPFGDPRLVEPFDVDCAAPGQARWANARNWVYDFAADLPSGIVCTFTAKAGLTALADAPVASRPLPPPAGVRREVLRFEPPIEPPRAELFLAGAEVNRIQVITDARPRLAYPDDGSILALDPDIAADQQRVALNVTSTRTDLVWSNGRPTA
jgi:hypothetical protein